MRCRHLFSMVIVMPTLAMRNQRNQPVVAAIIGGAVVAIAPQVGE